MSRRIQTRREEIANSLSHGIGAIAAVIALPVLIINALKSPNANGVWTATIFGSTLVLLYLTSSIYHALPGSRIKDLFRKLDHIAIFLLIAGTYTPFTLGVLQGAWGWSIISVVWGLAFAGIIFKIFGGVKNKKISIILYVGMGWIFVIAAKPLWIALYPSGIFWLLAGGLFYTVGVVFYSLDKVRYSHFIWHLFVLGGSFCHFIAVLWYVG